MRQKTYRSHRSPSARKRIQEEDQEEIVLETSCSSMKTDTNIETPSSFGTSTPIEVPNRSYQVYCVDSGNQRSQNILSSTSFFSSGTVGTDCNLDGLNGVCTRQNRYSHKTLMESSMGVTPSLGKPEPIKGENSMIMKDGITLYDQSLDGVESAADGGEDFTKWASRYLYGRNSNRPSTRKEKK